jgi:fatty acid desaturase
VVNDYSTLLRSVRDAGLLRRRRGFYVGVFSVLLLLLAVTWTGFFLVGTSWLQLLVAAVLGIVLTQFALLAHEAAHHQVFAARAANDWFGRFLGLVLVGISFAYWVDKHGRHHAHPNVVGVDPDIETGVIAFHPAAASARHGFMAAVTRRQGYLLFPLLPFLGAALPVDSYRYLCRRAPIHHRWLEISALTVRLGLYLGVVFLILPAGLAISFLAVQTGIFGFYMGLSFAPNHKGMPLLSKDQRLDFLRRQVLTSRNITGGSVVTALMGGLNHQVEHHLFPDMPRPHLRAARRIVRDYCAENRITYTETSLLTSYGILVRSLNRVGLREADPFECPLSTQYRP